MHTVAPSSGRGYWEEPVKVLMQYTHIPRTPFTTLTLPTRGELFYMEPIKIPWAVELIRNILKTSGNEIPKEVHKHLLLWHT